MDEVYEYFSVYFSFSELKQPSCCQQQFQPHAHIPLYNIFIPLPVLLDLYNKLMLSSQSLQTKNKNPVAIFATTNPHFCNFVVHFLTSPLCL